MDAGSAPVTSGPVFIFRGKPITSVQTASEKTRTKVGLEDVRFHGLVILSPRALFRVSFTTRGGKEKVGRQD